MKKFLKFEWLRDFDLRFVGAMALGLLGKDQLKIRRVQKEYISRPVLLKNVRIIDLEKERVSDRLSDITIEKGRISLIAPSGKIDQSGFATIEGGNRFVLPGLIDCHIHICGIFVTELPGPADITWVFDQVSLNHRATLQSGVTLVRDMMSAARASLFFKKLAEDPLSGYPRVLCSGPMFTVKNGYPPYVPQIKDWQKVLAGQLKLEIEDKKQAVKWVDRLADMGVDYIKIGYQSALFDVTRTPLKNISPRLFRVIVDRAHHHELPVGVHHYWIKDLETLLDLPFDTLEHITEDGKIDPRTLDRIAGRGLSVTTDLEQSAFAHEPEKFLERIEQGKAHMLTRPEKAISKLLNEVVAGKDIYGLKPRRKLMELAFIKDLVITKMHNAKLLSDNDILLGAASDSGVHMMMGILPEELVRLTRAGLSNAKALRSATHDAAKLLRVEDVGWIKKGYRGDFVLYDDNPLLNIEAVRTPALVIRDGVPQFSETNFKSFFSKLN